MVAWWGPPAGWAGWEGGQLGGQLGGLRRALPSGRRREGGRQRWAQRRGAAWLTGPPRARHPPACAATPQVGGEAPTTPEAAGAADANDALNALLAGAEAAQKEEGGGDKKDEDEDNSSDEGIKWAPPACLSRACPPPQPMAA
jgi:hypothetical protein